VDVILDF